MIKRCCFCLRTFSFILCSLFSIFANGSIAANFVSGLEDVEAIVFEGADVSEKIPSLVLIQDYSESSISLLQVFSLIVPLALGFALHLAPSRRCLHLSADRSISCGGFLNSIICFFIIAVGATVSGILIIALVYLCGPSCWQLDFAELRLSCLIVSILFLSGMTRSCVSSYQIFSDELKNPDGMFRLFFKGILSTIVMVIVLSPLFLFFQDFFLTSRLYQLILFSVFSIGIGLPFVLVALFPRFAQTFAVLSPVVKFFSAMSGWVLMFVALVFLRLFSELISDKIWLWSLLVLIFCECGMLEMAARWKQFYKIKLGLFASMTLLSGVFVIVSNDRLNRASVNLSQPVSDNALAFLWAKNIIGDKIC